MQDQQTGRRVEGTMDTQAYRKRAHKEGTKRNNELIRDFFRKHPEVLKTHELLDRMNEIAGHAAVDDLTDEYIEETFVHEAGHLVAALLSRIDVKVRMVPVVQWELRQGDDGPYVHHFILDSGVEVIHRYGGTEDEFKASVAKRLVVMAAGGVAEGRLRPSGHVENSMEQDRDNLKKAMEHYNGVLLKARMHPITADPEELWKECVRTAEKWFDEVPNFGDCVLKVADVLSRKDGNAAVAEARKVVEEFLGVLKPPESVPMAA
jgi:hypothetical protein